MGHGCTQALSPRFPREGGDPEPYIQKEKAWLDSFNRRKRSGGDGGCPLTQPSPSSLSLRGAGGGPSFGWKAGRFSRSLTPALFKALSRSRVHPVTNFLHLGDLPDGLDLGSSVAIDSETMGLRLGRDPLCVVQLSSGNGDAHVVQMSRPGYDAPNLKRILTDPTVLKLSLIHISEPTRPY